MSIVNSEYSTKSNTASVYQTDGKPLSPEALYKAKLKYGIYNNPTTQSIGVPASSTASDTAALLATSTDLSIEPYKRQLAADAQTAALFARKDTAPQRWSKDHIDTDAANAALHAKTIKEQIKPTDFSKSNAAAASVLTKGSHSIASSNLSSLYEFDAVRNGSKNSHSTLNIDLLTKASKERANTLINERINPERDASRLGLITDKGDDSKLETFAAVGALASQKLPKPVDPNLEARAVYKNSLVDPKVLAKARLNADSTLSNIEKKLGEKDLFYNPEFNKAAIAIAQSHATKRLATTDKVNLGGGLFMSQEELDSIASKIVNPVLADITKRAATQREKDAELAKQKEEQIKAHRQFKLQQQAKKLEEKRLKEEAKIKRRKELEDEKQKQRDLKLELENSKKAELSKHKEILTAKQQEEERKKNELLAKKQAEEERISSEQDAASKLRKEELTKAQEERDLKLAPIIEKLKIETDKLAVLNEEKQAIQDITNSQIKNSENAKSLLEVSQTELLESEKQLSQLKLDIENSTTEQEKLLKEHELKKQEAEVALKKSNEIEAEALLKQAEIEKEKAIVENERLKLELELENAKIEALQEEKKIVEITPPKKDEDEVVTSSATDKEATTTGKTTSGVQTIVTGTGAITKDFSSTKSVVDASGTISPKENGADKVKSLVDEALGNKEIDGGELKQTFSGFSQGSVKDQATTTTNAEQSVEKDDKHKSFFKEEF